MDRGFPIVSFGELRGEFMAQRRRLAFVERYGREPNFFLEDDKGNLREFWMADALVDCDTLYDEFEDAIVERVRVLPRKNRA